MELGRVVRLVLVLGIFVLALWSVSQIPIVRRGSAVPSASASTDQSVDDSGWHLDALRNLLDLCPLPLAEGGVV